MNEPNSPNFDPGGLPDRYDNRDYQWAEVGGAPVEPFDWNKGYDVEQEIAAFLGIPTFKLVVKNQNGSFSCGGQAWSYLAEVLEAISTVSYEPRSAKYLYSQTYVPGGGSRGRDNAEVFVNQGVAKESVLTSYDNGASPSEAFMEHSQDITDAVRQDARLSMASAYAQTGVDIESVATAIRTNHGVVLGVDGSNNGTWSSEFPKPPATTIWRHWIYCCRAKLIDGKKYIGFINSWGNAPGNQGWQWLGEDYFANHVFSGWTHVFAKPVSTVFTHDFLVNMAYGDNNAEVKALQTALQIDGEFPKTVNPTGFFGDITARAVLAFQNKYGIAPADSRHAGPKTRLQLNKLF